MPSLLSPSTLRFSYLSIHLSHLQNPSAPVSAFFYAHITITTIASRYIPFHPISSQLQARLLGPAIFERKKLHVLFVSDSPSVTPPQAPQAPVPAGNADGSARSDGGAAQLKRDAERGDWSRVQPQAQAQEQKQLEGSEAVPASATARRHDGVGAAARASAGSRAAPPALGHSRGGSNGPRQCEAHEGTRAPTPSSSLIPGGGSRSSSSSGALSDGGSGSGSGSACVHVTDADDVEHLLAHPAEREATAGPRTYTLTHSDVTSQLTLAIAHARFNKAQVRGRMMQQQQQRCFAVQEDSRTGRGRSVVGVPKGGKCAQGRRMSGVKQGVHSSSLRPCTRPPRGATSAATFHIPRSHHTSCCSGASAAPRVLLIASPMPLSWPPRPFSPATFSPLPPPIVCWLAVCQLVLSASEG